MGGCAEQDAHGRAYAHGHKGKGRKCWANAVIRPRRSEDGQGHRSQPQSGLSRARELLTALAEPGDTYNAPLYELEKGVSLGQFIVWW